MAQVKTCSDTKKSQGISSSTDLTSFYTINADTVIQGDLLIIVKIHTDGFHRQVEDLSFMVNLAVEGVKDNEVYIVGHSMGGLISLRYLELFPDTIMRAVVTSPMLKMQTPFPETASYYIAKGACYFGKCEDWIMGQNPENVKDASYLDLRETHNERLHEDYVAAIKKDPDNRITWGVTYGWFKQAMDMEYQVRDDKEISKINTDFLMLTATDDYFVDVETQKYFALRLNAVDKLNLKDLGTTYCKRPTNTA